MSSGEQTRCTNLSFPVETVSEKEIINDNQLAPQRYTASTSNEPVVCQTVTSRQLRTLQQDHDHDME